MNELFNLSLLVVFILTLITLGSLLLYVTNYFRLKFDLRESAEPVDFEERLIEQKKTLGCFAILLGIVWIMVICTAMFANRYRIHDVKNHESTAYHIGQNRIEVKIQNESGLILTEADVFFSFVTEGKTYRHDDSVNLEGASEDRKRLHYSFTTYVPPEKLLDTIDDRSWSIYIKGRKPLTRLERNAIDTAGSVSTWFKGLFESE